MTLNQPLHTLPFGHALSAVLAATLLAACTQCGRQPPAPTPETTEAAAPAPSVDLWTYAANTPAWVWIDAASIRQDPRLQALWEEAGTAMPAPGILGDVQADTLILTWRDPLFEEQVNILASPRAPLPDEDALQSAGYVRYRVGQSALWRQPGSSWGLAHPEPSILLTGAAEAVSDALRAPCTGCEPPGSLGPPGTILSARVQVTDDHRRLARIVASLNAINHVLEAIDHVEANVVLGLGADLRVAFFAREGQTPDFTAALFDEILQTLREILSRSPETTFAHSLLERAQLDRRGSTLELTLEIGRDELDMILSLVAFEGEDTTPPPADDDDDPT